MKWSKLGRIFDPTTASLPNNCQSYAQSPQALLFDDFIRIYFSSREVDQRNGKYLSHVLFVDVTKDLKRVTRISEKAVISLGGLGSFDEHGIFPMNVLRHNGRIYGYTCGWNRKVSVSVDTSIGLAMSDDDGQTFQRVGPGPVLTASLREPFLVGDPFVKVIDGAFHMWYIFGTSWKRFSNESAPDRVYKIGHAISVDGLVWQKDEGTQIVPDRLGPDESQALPTVIKVQGAYHMFFCYRQSHDFRTNKDRGYRIGHAVSRDLLTWSREDNTFEIGPSEKDWDSDMLCYPHVFEMNDKVYLLYNGNEFGKHGFGAALLV